MRSSRSALAFAFIIVAGPRALPAQVQSTRFPVWRAELGRAELHRLPSSFVITERRSHTTTGLLIGAAAGAAATTLFLVGFCAGADTACQADEVGRAALIIGVPITAAGALIGSLIRTGEK